MSTYIPDLPITAIGRHPKNPRHSAAADPELVESVRVNGLVQPLIVAPVADTDGYVLIAGHRRLDALKKAKRKAAPAVVREDLITEGQQVEAMLIENGRRKDLTPIEEAEGYEQLVLFGYKQKDIAKAVGRDPKTISSRLRLLKLTATTKQKVHKGQLTLDDAAAIAEFTDDPATVKRLEQTAGSSYNFQWELQRARRERKDAREVATTVADLAARGIPETQRPEGAGYRWSAWSTVDDARSIEDTPLRDPAEHDGCLTWMQYSPTELIYGCTHPTGHDDMRSEAQRQREREAADAAAAAEQAARDAAAARTVRIRAAIESVGRVTLPAPLLLLVHYTLPAVIAELSGDALEAYQDAVGIVPEHRWKPNYSGNIEGQELMRLLDHVDDLDRLADNTISRAFTAALMCASDHHFEAGAGYGRTPALGLRHHELLQALGYGDTPVDKQLLEDLEPAKQEAS